MNPAVVTGACSRYFARHFNFLSSLSFSFPSPSLCFNSWNPYPFIYLQPVKCTPFRRRLPVQSIIWSTPRGPGPHRALVRDLGTTYVFFIFIYDEEKIILAGGEIKCLSETFYVSRIVRNMSMFGVSADREAFRETICFLDNLSSFAGDH